MSNKLHDKVRAALAARSQWEMRQSRWQEMRHDGERRQVRPWKGAADMHFPLAPKPQNPRGYNFRSYLL